MDGSVKRETYPISTGAGPRRLTCILPGYLLGKEFETIYQYGQTLPVLTSRQNPEWAGNERPYPPEDISVLDTKS